MRTGSRNRDVAREKLVEYPLMTSVAARWATAVYFSAGLGCGRWGSFMMELTLAHRVRPTVARTVQGGQRRLVVLQRAALRALTLRISEARKEEGMSSHGCTGL